MAAVNAAVMANVRAGDHIVAPESMYSTTMNLFRHLAANFQIETTFIDASDPENYHDAAAANTKLFWLESPSNPLLTITDLQAVSSIAKSDGILTVADNTFATPLTSGRSSSGSML